MDVATGTGEADTPELPSPLDLRITEFTNKLAEYHGATTIGVFVNIPDEYAEDGGTTFLFTGCELQAYAICKKFVLGVEAQWKKEQNENDG